MKCTERIEDGVWFLTFEDTVMDFKYTENSQTLWPIQDENLTQAASCI